MLDRCCTQGSAWGAQSLEGWDGNVFRMAPLAQPSPAAGAAAEAPVPSSAARLLQLVQGESHGASSTAAAAKAGPGMAPTVRLAHPLLGAQMAQPAAAGGSGPHAMGAQAQQVQQGQSPSAQVGPLMTSAEVARARFFARRAPGQHPDQPGSAPLAHGHTQQGLQGQPASAHAGVVGPASPQRYYGLGGGETQLAAVPRQLLARGRRSAVFKGVWRDREVAVRYTVVAEGQLEAGADDARLGAKLHHPHVLEVRGCMHRGATVGA